MQCVFISSIICFWWKPYLSLKNHLNHTDKENMKTFFLGFVAFCLCAFAFGQGIVEAQSKVNWITKEFFFRRIS